MNTEKYGDVLCKNHSARSEKEFCRVCPSNLNKKELENVYFTLLESNLGLKTTINSQREKIKILSTKVQRLTALQKSYLGKESKECCGSKALVNEQKECISELRRSNQCLSERVRQLNMRLCSAKQFLKRSPFQSTSRCNRCSNKNASMSALITKRSETNLRTTVASSQYLVKDLVSSRTTDNVIISHEIGVQYDYCDENKCRNRIEELKKENDDLKEELSKITEKHEVVASQMGREAGELRAESVRVRSERALADERAGRLRDQLADVTARLGAAELRCDELSVEVSVERRRAAELATRLRAADMSSRIADVIETHLTNIKMLRDQQSAGRSEPAARDLPAPGDSRNHLSENSPYRPKPAARTKVPSVQVDDVFRSSDDSGYTEINKSQELDDTKASTYINQVLLEKIADLQNQINKLKAFKNNYNKSNEPLNVTQDINTEGRQALKQSSFSDQHDLVVKETPENVIATQHTNSNKSDDVESTTQVVDQINKSAEIAKQPSDFNDHRKEKGDHNGHIQQQNDLNGQSKLRESVESVINQSKYNRERNTSTLNGSRKLSLQTSRNTLKDKDMIKASSLDESAINNVVSNTGRLKTIEVKNIVRKGKNRNQLSHTTNNIANTEDLRHPDETVQRTQQVNKSDKDIDEENKTTAESEKIVHSTEGETIKDSDSSKGTYTIHKDEPELKLKTKPTGASSDIMKQNKESSSNPDLVPYTASDVKRVLHKASKELHRRRSAASEPRTYVKGPRHASPESTEYEISSMSDLPSERDERTVCSRSPGEERAATDTSLTTPTALTTTDCGSLSEGELPGLGDAFVLSDGEKRLPNRRSKSHSVPMANERQMEETLAAVRRELGRCTRLLHARSLDTPRPPHPPHPPTARPLHTEAPQWLV